MKGKGHYSKAVSPGKRSSGGRTSIGPKKPPGSYSAAGAKVKNNGSRLNRSPRSR